MRIVAGLALVGFGLLNLEGNAYAQEGGASAFAPPPAAAPPDIVVLKDGSMVRGTIVELRAGDRVQIMTITGESRSYTMDTVEYAGAAAERPPRSVPPGPAASSVPPARGMTGKGGEVQPRVVVHGEEANVSFAATEPLTFHLRGSSAVATSSSGGVAFAQGYDEICTTPCRATLSAGTHSLALSTLEGTPIEAGPVTLPAGKSNVEGQYDSRRGTRTTGWIVMIGGGLVGTALMFTGISCGGRDECDMTQLYVGTGVFLGSLTVGMVLAMTRDKAKIHVAGEVPEEMRTARRVELRASPRGVEVLGTF